MRLKVCAAAFLLLAVCFPINLSAQTEANPKFGNRDVAALAVVEQALATMGGNAAITQLRDCVTRGNLVRPAGVVTPGGDFTWKNSGDEFRYEHKGSPTLVSGRGNPAHVGKGKTEKLFAHVAISDLPAHLAALGLLKRWKDKKYGFSLLEDGQVAGNPAVRVKTWLESDELMESLTSQTWFFDKASGLPVRVEYKVPDVYDAVRQSTVAVELSDFRLVSGVLVPFRINTYLEGKQIADITINAVSFNQGINASEFDGGAR